MAEETTERVSSSEKEKEEKRVVDLEHFSCLLQPSPADSDPNYIGIRRFLLYKKAESGVDRRKEWRCNGKGYVAFRNYIRRPRNWESLHIPSGPSTPGTSGRWLPSPVPLSMLYEVDSWSSSKDVRGYGGQSHRTSFSSNASDSGRLIQKVEPAYSFVGMHCIFDSCKASDPLAYGASDGTLTVCKVSQPPSVLTELRGHSKAVTDFDFSSNNQYIASSSMDKTVRVWEISKGHCIRVIYGVSSQLCIRFHPVSAN